MHVHALTAWAHTLVHTHTRVEVHTKKWTTASLRLLDCVCSAWARETTTADAMTGYPCQRPSLCYHRKGALIHPIHAAATVDFIIKHILRKKRTSIALGDMVMNITPSRWQSCRSWLDPAWLLPATVCTWRASLHEESDWMFKIEQVYLLSEEWAG